jgi:hypothetical protein
MRQTQLRVREFPWEGMTAVSASEDPLSLTVTDGRIGADVIRSELPGTDPYVGWCGRRRLITPGYPSRVVGFATT